MRGGHCPAFFIHMTKNIWFTGIPGSKWSGVDIQMRQFLDADRTDETPERTMYHRAKTPTDSNNGHRGSYFGPGMGCGEDWIDFNFVEPSKLQNDINAVFSGEGYRIIKSHFLARKFNLDYIWNNFPGDYMVLIYREPQKSFAWWSEVMDFSDGHYPDYRPGYTDYNTMRNLLYIESAKITDFAIRKGLNFKQYSPSELAKYIEGANTDIAETLTANGPDIYFAVARIPN